MDSRLISQAILVSLAALLQNFSWLSLNGIRVNLVLLIVLALIFMVRNLAEYLFLLILAGWWLRIDNGWDISVVIFILILALTFFLKKFLPWQSIISYLIFVFFTTIAFYILLDWNFVSKDYPILIKEIIYNLIFGGFLYLILVRFYDEKTRVKF